LRWWRQITLAIAVIALITLAGREPVITDSFGREPPAGVRLELPAGYIATSPVSRLLDALSLLSNPQTFALFGTLAVIVVSWIVVTRRRSHRAIRKRVLLGLGGLLAIIVIVEAAVVFAPRPMARLRVADPDVVIIDFHSHTGASHDVRKSFTAEDNREWHRSGGFDVAYISDHVKFGGAVAGLRLNPARAGGGTFLLSAVEGRYHRIMSTIMLGMTEADTANLNRRGNLLPGVTASARRPVAIVALPNRNLDSLTLESLDSLPRFAGLELVDAAPRGLSQFDREEDKVRRIASERRLILVAASNNHGWGRTVAAWNLMTIPGWRNLSPDSVGRLIEAPFRERRLDAVTIVRRVRPGLHGVNVVWTLPALLYQIVASLTPIERAVWLVWILALSIAWRQRPQRRLRTAETSGTFGSRM